MVPTIPLKKLTPCAWLVLKMNAKQNESGSKGKVCCLKQGQDLKASAAHFYPNRR